MDEMVSNNLFASLDIMWRGMLGLFIVCGAIAVVMVIIAKCMKKKKE
jgi:Mg2+/Co2+ transporter CorB